MENEETAFQKVCREHLDAMFKKLSNDILLELAYGTTDVVKIKAIQDGRKFDKDLKDLIYEE